MNDQVDVTHWLAELKAGNAKAAEHLWEVYFRRLVGLARNKLQDFPRRAGDEEDVALSAFASFCRGVDRGCFPRLDDRDDLRQVLVMLTVRKARDVRKHEGREKRGGGAVRGESALVGSDGEGGLDALKGDEVTPAEAVVLAEQCRRLLDALPDETLRKLALDKLEGYTNPELAERLGFSRATVERKLARIREIWNHLSEET